jgi:RNA polymerase sigma factor (sigma-70 family)
LTHLLAAEPAHRQRAWQRWYERDYPLVSRYSRRRALALGCPEQHDDIAQETFVIAFKNLQSGRFQPQGKALCAYLYGIARNLLYDTARRRAKETTQAAALGVPDDVPDDRQLTLADRACLSDFLATVAQARAELTPSQRRVLDCLYGAGKNSQEVACELAQSAVNVRAIASRAVGALHAAVTKRYEPTLSTDAIRLALQCLDVVDLVHEN